MVCPAKGRNNDHIILSLRKIISRCVKNSLSRSKAGDRMPPLQAEMLEIMCKLPQQMRSKGKRLYSSRWCVGFPLEFKYDL